jgi:hypothetical protein
MRTAILAGLFAVFGSIANAQLSILPQVGIEDARTTLKYNGQAAFSPLCLQPSPQASLRLDYIFNKTHGPWVSAGTSRHIISYNFADPETGMNEYAASRENTQLRLEAGYQLKTKPIFLKKRAAPETGVNNYRSHCLRQTERSSCGSKASQLKTKKSERGSWLKLAPAAGIAYIPSAPGSALEAKTTAAGNAYSYNAGNWRTAFLGGIGFEFGKNNRPYFNLSLNYLKGFGNNLDTKQITTVSGNKTTNTSLSSSSSAWSLRMGVPISLSKKKAAAKEQVVEKTCTRETRKCGTDKSQYKPRCYKTYIDQ